VAAAGTAGVADSATQGALLYLMAYMFTNLGAFGVALAVEKDDGSGTNLEDFVGLAKSRPLLAFMMAVFMLSLTGIPLTSGFIGKWFVFRATLEAGLVPVAIIGVLTSVASAFYYLRIVVNMYLRDGEGDPANGATPYVTWGIYVAFAGTVIMGIFPFLVTGLSDTVSIAAIALGAK
jgi:NADH-quinone oxidoreductase subunit N